MIYRYTIKRFRPEFDIVRCSRCGLERQSVLPQIDQMYDEDYYSGKSEYSYKDERKNEKYEAYVWRARLKRIAEFVPAPADFLDVGCAYGGLALEARASGYSAKGLDISKHAVAEARKRGLDAKQGRISRRVVVLWVLPTRVGLPAGVLSSSHASPSRRQTREMV
ncbi:MAG TPA: methyltransferase domain-containing protein [Leptospiraceae bacterium]|nr:methyltransferase domain-containing protein [Leptospiraceae bacterium]